MERLLEIEEELKQMGGAPKYDTLPDGCMDVERFTRQVADLKKNISIYEAQLDTNAHILMKTEGNEALRTNWKQNTQENRRLMNHLKDQLLVFLTQMKPICSERYLAKKHKLLDEKLQILEKQRMKEVQTLERAPC
jgi:hypothetical protein